MLLQWHHTSWKCLFWALYICFEMQYLPKEKKAQERERINGRKQSYKEIMKKK